MTVTNEPIEYQAEEGGYFECINEDVPYIVREIDGRVAILSDMHTRKVVGYRVYDPGASDAEMFGSAALSAQPAVAVPAVKPLEWRDIYQDDPHRREDWRADANPIGKQYRVLRAYWGKEDKWGYCCAESDEVWFHTAETAKAAAQADYERRILSALTAPPSAPQPAPQPVAVKPLLGTRFKLSFDSKGRCTTFYKHQVEELHGEWVWLIEATNGMNDTLFPAAPSDEWTKVVSRLTQERDEAREENERLAKSMREYAFTANNALAGWADRATAAEARVKALEEENERLREALEESDCPAPVITDDRSVKACVASGQCGCGNRAALKGGEA